MKCNQNENVRVYLTNRLTDKAKKKFEKHLSICPRCSAKVKILGRVKEVLADESDFPGINIVDKTIKKIGKSLIKPTGKRIIPEQIIRMAALRLNKKRKN